MNTSFNELISNIVEKAEKILLEYPLCHYCLGRVFAKYGIGLTNYERGLMITTLLAIKMFEEYKSNIQNRDNHRLLALNGGGPLASAYKKIYKEEITPRSCFICNSRLSRELIEEIAREACNALREHDAKSFIVGVNLDGEIRSSELELIMKYGSETAESIKRELKREVGKAVMEICGLKPDFEKPDVVVIVKLEKGFEYQISIEPNPLFYSGIYWKLGRNISHVPWSTRTGSKKYPLSIQEFVENALKDVFEASEVIIHAAGREDVDARMLGSGRPLIVEIVKPRRRDIDIDKLNSVLNKQSSIYPVKVVLSSRSSRGDIRRIKGESKHRRKIYRITVYSPVDLSPGELIKLEEFYINREITQRTPTRILRRKKDRVRKRRVYSVKTLQISSRVFEALIYCDGGLYVKELVHGDNGRTTPSFSEVLGIDLKPIELDVLFVES